MINNIHAQEVLILTQIQSSILVNVINVQLDTSAHQGPTDLSSVLMAIIALLVLRIISITLVLLAHILLQEDYQMHHNAEAVLKAHSARTTKLCSQRNVQLEATVMWKVPSNLTTFILLLASYANNACQDINAQL